jgi:hypothetical protein
MPSQRRIAELENERELQIGLLTCLESLRLAEKQEQPRYAILLKIMIAKQHLAEIDHVLTLLKAGILSTSDRQ